MQGNPADIGAPGREVFDLWNGKCVGQDDSFRIDWEREEMRWLLSGSLAIRCDTSSIRSSQKFSEMSYLRAVSGFCRIYCYICDRIHDQQSLVPLRIQAEEYCSKPYLQIVDPRLDSSPIV